MSARNALSRALERPFTLTAALVGVTALGSAAVLSTSSPVHASASVVPVGPVVQPTSHPAAAPSSAPPPRVADAAPSTHRPMGQPPAPTVDCRRTACIALTFDDGPGPYTDQIRRTLQDNGARATFFVIGRSAEADKGAVARLHAAGMEVGDHTYSHQSLAHMATAVQQREVGRAADVVEQAAGARPYLLRPPYGALGASTLHLGWPVVTWDVDTQDWVNRNASVTTQRALAGARPGAIILMHDIQPSTAAALPGIVTELKRRGYTLVTVNDILGGARADGRAHERGLVGPQPRPIAPAATQDATPGAPPTAPAPSAPAPTPPAPTVTSPAASTPPPSGPTTQPARQPGTSHPSTHSRGRPGNAPGLAKPPGSDAARTRQPVTPKIPRPQTKTKGAQ